MFAPLLLLWFWADANQAKSLLQHGLIALQHGQLTEARAAFEEASHVEPGNPYVWASLAETYLRLKEPDKASTAAQTAEKGVADHPLIAHALAMYYSEAGDAAHAARLEEQYRSAAWEEAKTDPHLAFRYVQILLEREEFTRAVEVTDTALAANPNDVQLILALGVARYGQRRFDEALKEFLEVIRVDPSIEQPYLFIGRMLEQAGPHIAEIETAYEAWAAREPRNAKAQLLLAKVALVEDHNSRRAESLLRRSISLDDKDWEAHYELGALLESRHDYQAASSELIRSIELNPKEPMPHYHLARIYDRLGQPERAAAERELHQKLTAPKAP